VFSGILAAMIVSPILDRTKGHLLAFKILCVFIAASYTAYPFIPQTRSVPAVIFIFIIMGVSAITAQPPLLELQASWTHPVSPEFSSFICWGGARVIAATFTLIVGNALVLDEPQNGHPEGSLSNGLIFTAVMCWICVPLAWLTGVWKFKRTEASKVEGNI
jgi:MFS transporter, FLVCR family, MFS-domain-containing protein 7